MKSVLHACASLGSLGVHFGVTTSSYTGEHFSSRFFSWFAENDITNVAIISGLLDSRDYEGLNWLLTSSQSMFENFGANPDDTSGLNENGDAAQNGYWEIFDMIDLLAGEFGTWIKAHDIYPSIVMNYFIHLRPGPDDGSIGQPAGIDLSFKLFS
jgi:hypothetical protein